MPGRKKAAKKKTTKPLELWSATPLAALSDAVIFDCVGDTIAAINNAGQSLLTGAGKKAAGKGLKGRALLDHFTDAKGKALKTVAALAKGPQPKRLMMVRGKGTRVPVDVSAKSLGGRGAAARTLVVAKLVPAKPPSSKSTKAVKPAALAVAAPVAAPSSFTAQILGATSNGIVALDLAGNITLANPAAADLLNRDAAAMQGLSIERVFVYGSGHDSAGKPIPIKAQLLQGPHYVDREVQLARTDGESFEATYVVVPVTENRNTIGYVITFRDITRRRRAEAEMRLAGVVFDHSPEGIVVADAKGRVTKINPAYRRISGNENAHVLGKQLAEVLFTESKSPSSVLDMLQGSDQTQWEQWCKSTAGRRYAARISVSVVRDHTGSIQQYVAIIADVTQRKLDEEKIIYQANYDQLTSLPNRTLFMDRLTRLVLEGRRAKTSIGLMFIDLDGFKAINDNLGHDAGDVLLVSTARRLEKCVREADTVARLGGDEFTVIMPLIDNFDAAGFVAARIIKSLTEPFDLGGREGNVSASIGISLLPAQASTAQDLLHNADVAMYHAKRQGKANYQFYRPELEDIVKVKDREI
jgi:diguanylate cyclase (GGDEF)-like protein/PAS domain S-box-containing protein